MMNDRSASAITDDLRARLYDVWQPPLVEALRETGWQRPLRERSNEPVPWDEVAAVAIDTLWTTASMLVASALEVTPSTPPPVPASEQSPTSLLNPWLSAEEAAPLLRTTAHTMRRLAREDRSPVIARRIGGRWWFARIDVERFLGLRPPGEE